MRVALATSADYPFLIDEDRLLIDEFAKRGAMAGPVVWNAPGVKWSSYDLVLIRSCWDYHLHADRFREWIEHLVQAAVTLLNPAGLVLWNMDKRYLAALERSGVPVPPTIWSSQGDTTRLAEILAANGWTEAVVKPTVSASATNTWRVGTSSAAAAEPAFRELLGRGGVMVQEFMNDVVRHGELSMIFIDGQFSHAVVKRAAPGDFRVQEEHGGSAEVATCDDRTIGQAASIVQRLPQKPLYVRIDGVVSSGSFVLMEAECIEPRLYLDAASCDLMVTAALDR